MSCLLPPPSAALPLYQTHSSAKNLYGVSFRHFHDLGEIFGKDYATGKRSEDILDAVDNMEKGDYESSNEHGDGAESAPPTKKAKKGKEKGSASDASGLSGASDLSCLQNFMQDTNVHLATIESAWTRQQERGEEIANKSNKVMDELLKLDGLTTDQILEAATVLTAKPQAQCFLSVSNFYEKSFHSTHSWIEW